MHAFIDTEIIAKAPCQYMWAGIGDTYAKYYEATISSGTNGWNISPPWVWP